MAKKRISNIEILRLICMLLIVTGHAATHGYDIPNLPRNANGLLTIAMSQGARIAVDIFVLITGYFSTDTTIKWKKIYKLYTQVWFYSVSLTAVSVLIFHMQVTPRQIISALLPVYTSQYWFATCFILLMMLAPFLNIMTQHLERKQHSLMLQILIVPLCIIPTFSLTYTPSYFNNLLWFLTLYLTGTYIRKYPLSHSDNISWKYGISFLALIMISASLIFYMGYQHTYLRYNTIYILSELNKVPALISALLLFIGFRNLRVGANRTINYISAKVFSVYLISDHPMIRKIIFQPISNHIESNTLIYTSTYISWIIVIYISSILIEITRKKISENIQIIIHAIKTKDA